MITIHSVTVYRHPKGWILKECPACQSKQPILVLYEVDKPGSVEPTKIFSQHWGWCNYCEHEFLLDSYTDYQMVEFDPNFCSTEILSKGLKQEYAQSSRHSDNQVKAVLDRAATATIEGGNFPVKTLLTGSIAGSIILPVLSVVTWKMNFRFAELAIAQHVSSVFFGFIIGVIVAIVVNVSCEHPEKMLQKLVHLMKKNGIPRERVADISRIYYPKLYAYLMRHQTAFRNALASDGNMQDDFVGPDLSIKRIGV